ncbi:MAG: glycosyltransferase [Sphingomonadales bacterium]|nr:glycosyltransferase [Sphingomonadales bacterium]
MSEIAVIVVNYGTAGLALAAVQSVLDHQHPGHRVEVHLVDNASPGEDAAVFAAEHAARGWGARVTLWPETQNHGFGRGNNVVLAALAARDTPPDHVFLLNPDAALANEAIAILADFLDAHPGVGAAGSGIRSPSGAALTAAFRFPSPAREFVSAVSFGPLARLFPRARVALGPDTPAGEVDWVAGAAVMFRFGPLQALGGFDPDFFLYYEEVELMHRLRAAGHAIWYLPQAQVIHAEGASTQVKSLQSARKRKPAYWYRSWRLYYSKTRGRAGAVGAALAWISGASVNFALAVLRRREPAAPLHFYGDVARHVVAPLIRGGSPADG